MTTQEFKDRLQGLVALGDDFGALVFFAIRNEDGIVLKKANIINDVLTEIASGYRESIQAELNRFLQDDHMSVLNLSDRDERENVIYRYDIPDVEPSYFAQMREPVAEDAPEYINDRLFQFDQESFGDIDYFVVMLGTEENHVVVYRDNFNVNLLKQARGRYYLNKSGTQISHIWRFSNQRQFASFLGLVPVMQASGDNCYVGEKTFRGNKILGPKIIEASWVTIRYDSELAAKFGHLCNKGMKRNKAIIRIARKLSNVIFTILRENRKYVCR